MNSYTETFQDLVDRLPELTLRDERRLRRKLDAAATIEDPTERVAALTTLGSEIAIGAARVDRRRAALGEIGYPEELPVTARREEIAAAIAEHQVVIVAGETGSGKTTQLPKICAELGRGVRGLIGHTQPRRLAARTVAERIAAELGVELGGAVGYAVRHTDRVSDDTRIKVMTDGILLAEIGRSPTLLGYDTIIIDEAHERSLNIDFLLGYLTQLLPKRSDLKVIITSATIDSEKFATHFGGAPIIEVTGRTYPVELRYRPMRDSERKIDLDQTDAVCEAVDELAAEGPGDILAFFSGEREIRDAAEALRGRKLANTEVVPLFARLSVADQHRVFSPHPGRRIVLATNVAETSLTVPGVRYVIDTGTARISRFSNRTKVQRLPIEPVSQASANQRAGRCGRVADGICIRLYTETDFFSRPAYTDPEILRTNLAAVLLRMISLGLGDIAAFPFLDPPDGRAVSAGLQLLEELGALREGETRQLTKVGRALARLPVDPRFGRMLLEADRNGCLGETAVIVAGLSIQDPREDPADHREAARAQHARFADPNSDFVSLLNLWNYLTELRGQLSSSALRRRCGKEFLHQLRIREWEDLVSQLRRSCIELGMTASKPNAEPDLDRLHASLLAGLLSHIGLYDGAKREYEGARNTRFAIAPGSTLFRKSPRWVAAAELVETSRLWGRVAARIQPEWVEPLAEHLVKRQYSEPHWSRKRAAVLGYERVTLYGVPIVTQRPVNYARVDPVVARDLFIRHALVEGDWDTHHTFLSTNQRLLEEAADLEERVRRRGLVVDDEALYEFYDRRLGPDIVSGRHFDSWWKQARRETPDLLTFDPAQLLDAETVGDIDSSAYPLVWSTESGDDLPLSYVFEPGAADDGVSVDVPLAAIDQLRGEGLAWQVPGLRSEIVTTLLRGLPKPIRRRLVPVPDTAVAILSQLPDFPTDLLGAISDQLLRLTGVSVEPDDWDLAALPSHLRTTFRVVDTDGRELARGKDVAELRAVTRPHVRELLSAATGLERTGLTGWDFDALPRQVSGGDGRVTGYPALADRGGSADIVICNSEAEQRATMPGGVRRLLRLTVPAPTKSILQRLDVVGKLALAAAPHRDAAALLDDCADCAVAAITDNVAVWDRAGFDALAARVAAELPTVLSGIVDAVLPILTEARALRAELATPVPAALRPAAEDVTDQLSRLYYPGFVAATGVNRLRDLRRYLQAARHRLGRLREAPVRDADSQLVVRRLEEEYASALVEGQRFPAVLEALVDVRWMLQELRVSLFAQNLGTKYSVSPRRVERALDGAYDLIRAEA